MFRKIASAPALAATKRLARQTFTFPNVIPAKTDGWMT
jgi:hypothetical protein